MSRTGEAPPGAPPGAPPFGPDNPDPMQEARRRYRPPAAAPWRGARLDVVRGDGLGDVLMCTPALRAARRANPALRIRFYTRYPALVRGLPYIDEALDPRAAPRQAIPLGYEDCLPARRHLAAVIADMIGLDLADTLPDCVIRPDLVAQFRADWGAGPHLVISRRASRWTPNKDWPMARWNSLVERLGRTHSIIEIGEAPEPPTPIPAGRYRDLRGRTNLESLAAAVAAADVFLGPVSGPAHIAAAARVPAVIIAGGYEAAANTAYPTSRLLAETPPCSPCWLRTPCPHDRKCLTAISVETVETAVAQALSATHGSDR